MAWASKFSYALSLTPARPQFRFETLDLGTGAGNTPGSPSATNLISGFSSTSAGVQPLSWQATAGGFNVTIPTEDPGMLLQYLKRGALCRVRAAMGSTSSDQWQTVALGRILDVNGLAPEIQVQCIDLLQSLGSRLTTTPAELPLFANAGSTTTLTADYTAGSSSISVASSTAFVKETGGNGLLQITPTSGDPFFLTWSNKTASSFTISTSAILGTTAVDAVSGDTVTHLPYLVDHPLKIARKVLTSTGSGTNGSFDTLPKGWGYGLPADFFDANDSAINVSASAPSSGTGSWQVYVTDSQDDGGSWLRGILSPAGMWLTMRQGMITARAAFSVYTPPANLQPEITITDDDISAVSSHSRFDTSQAAQGAGIRVVGPTSSQTSKRSSIATLPAVEVIEQSLPWLARSNEAQQLESVRSRLLNWAASVPERISIVCSGLRLAGLAPGDLVQVTSRLLVGRIEGQHGFFRLRRAFVANVAIDWLGNTVRLELLCPTPPDNTYD